MAQNDWIALGIVAVFLLLGSFGSWRRRTRVALLIALFLGLHIYPWATTQRQRDSVMPFIHYRLYTAQAPYTVGYYELRMVSESGAEYDVDFRVWQPHIPRYFNVVLMKRMPRRLDPAVLQFFLGRIKRELGRFHERGRYEGANRYLLGPLHYPEHQTGAWRWGPGADLPRPEEIVAVRLYRNVSVRAKRQANPSDFRRRLLMEARESH